MDFSVIFQLRNKRFWWMDVIFYFVISLLIATILCYLIFLIKNNIQREDIKKETQALLTVGTDDQKAQEASVINYRNKINDFVTLFKNHEFASNAFAFIQSEAMPNIWFKQFNLDEKNSTMQLSGQTENMDVLSRQVDVFEKNKYVKNLGTLNTSLGQGAKIEFNINLTLDPNIFSYLADVTPILSTNTSSEQPLIQPDLTASENGQPSEQTPSSEKLITSFHLLSNPEVIGTLDETNYVVTLIVPYGTDLKNLKTAIIESPGATVSPSPDTPQDFSKSLTYTVTAEDGSAQDYKVVVNVLPQTNKKSGQSKLVILMIIALIVIVVVAVAVVVFFAWKKMKSKKSLNSNAN